MLGKNDDTLRELPNVDDGWEDGFMGEQPKKVGDYKVATGGLMRCCLYTLGVAANERVPSLATIKCSFCPTEMHILEGVWQWKREERDEELRTRLYKSIPQGIRFDTKEIDEASGAELDVIAMRLGTKRGAQR